MKKIIYSTLFAASLLMVSCGGEDSEKDSSDEENKTEEAKFDKSSAEYKMAEILCGCFETFNEDDPSGQMSAVQCMLDEMGVGSEELNDADEDETMEILEEICPETATKFQKWMDNMDKN